MCRWPGSEGYLGVLAHHAALVTELGRGHAHPCAKPGRRRTFRWQVSGGFFEVADNCATVLAEHGERGRGETRE